MMRTYHFKQDGANASFKSAREDITHCVVNPRGRIMAKCSSLNLAVKAKAKDERLYQLEGLEVVAVSHE